VTTPLLDTLSRPLGNLRLSVTDRCNLRCEYCMPEENYVWLPRENLLRFEEISTLVDVFLALGVRKVRVTGGEPLMRRDVPTLIQLLAAKPAIDDLALTTNGLLLADQADTLKAAGLGRITVSLDTLRPDRFIQLTRRDELEAVTAGIRAASRLWAGPGARGGAGHHAFKIDTVAMRGVNDDEIPDLVEYAKAVGAEIRFIEYMDVGGATRWSPDRVVSAREILDVLAKRYGSIAPLPKADAAPADRFALADGTVVGIIASTTTPFCRTCDRSRLTADGLWYLCLYAARGLDLGGALRRGATADELRQIVENGWRARDDRGAETRLALGDRHTFVPIKALRNDPHLEMHTRGG
jgi:cyclic pyranopterin phosphate synthase